MAVQVDYLQALIDRGDVYNPDAAPPSSPAPILIPVGVAESRWPSRFGAFRVLLAMAAVSWAVVAVETWMLIR